MSHFLARSPVRETPSHSRPESDRAFTLIELLAVIAIIGLLTAITFGVVKGVNERAAVGQAKAELSVLAQALEQYKRQYGDYPQTGAQTQASQTTSSALNSTDAQAYLFSALVGGVGPTLTPFAGKSFVDLSVFTQELGTTPTGAGPFKDCFLDPWGRRYMYYYRNTTTAWTQNNSYVLFSTGPDGKYTAPNTTTGDPQYTGTNNQDNIYANQN